MGPPPALPSEDGRNRRRATLAVLPFLVVGLGILWGVFGWGLEPLWALVIAPPILFLSTLAWIAFRNGFRHSRGGARARTADDEQ